MGGQRGDCYTAYPLLKGDTEEHICSIFRHAQVCFLSIFNVIFAYIT
jgi:hypothetical protein